MTELAGPGAISKERWSSSMAWSTSGASRSQMLTQSLLGRMWCAAKRRGGREARREGGKEARRQGGKEGKQ
jgi:hypothetical protein